MILSLILQQQSSFTAEVRAKPEYHKFLIGRGGANIRKVRAIQKFYTSNMLKPS